MKGGHMVSSCWLQIQVLEHRARYAGPYDQGQAPELCLLHGKSRWLAIGMKNIHSCRQTFQPEGRGPGLRVLQGEILSSPTR